MFPQGDVNNQDNLQALHAQFITLVWLLFRQVVQQMQTYGLTHPQFVTLASLVSHQNSANMRQLSGVTLQDAPTMTGIVDRLVNMGLVRRTRSETDRRVVLVEATPEGIALVKKIEQDFQSEKLKGICAIPGTDTGKMQEMLDYVLSLQLETLKEYGVPNLETAKVWLQQFAHDPIGFVKSQELE